MYVTKTDQEAIEELRARLTINSSAVTAERTWTLAALVQMYLGTLDTARESVRSALLLNPSSSSALSAQGWIDLASGTPRAPSVFDTILEKAPRDLDVCKISMPHRFESLTTC